MAFSAGRLALRRSSAAPSRAASLAVRFGRATEEAYQRGLPALSSFRASLAPMRRDPTRFNTAGGERSSFLGSSLPFTGSRTFDNQKQFTRKPKKNYVHVLLKGNKTFVTVTDTKGNKKTGASVGCLEDRKGRSRLSRYAAEATAEHVGRSARKMGLKSVVMKVKGASFFKKKKKVILGFREGFRGERVGEQSPIMLIHDVTQLPHNRCRLPKQRRI